MCVLGLIIFLRSYPPASVTYNALPFANDINRYRKMQFSNDIRIHQEKCQSVTIGEEVLNIFIV